MKTYIKTIATYNWDGRQRCYMEAYADYTFVEAERQPCYDIEQVGSDDSYAVTTYTYISGSELEECREDDELMMYKVQEPSALSWERIRAMLRYVNRR